MAHSATLMVHVDDSPIRFQDLTGTGDCVSINLGSRISVLGSLAEISRLGDEIAAAVGTIFAARGDAEEAAERMTATS